MLNNTFILISANLILFFFLNYYAYKINLLDFPNNRKLHKKPVPLVGGIAIGLSIILSVYLFDFTNPQFNVILSLSLLIMIAGVLDDFKNLNANNKLILQSVAIFIIIFKYDFFLRDLGEYPHIGLIELGSFGQLFTLLAIFLFINACNYLDGIDGSLGLVFFNSIILLYLNTAEKDADLNQFYIIISVPIIIFLFFNLITFFPKIFLGDAGSLLLGYLLSCTLIISYNVYQTHPIIIAWCVNLIVYDFLFVNTNRIKNKKNFTLARKDHIHHICLGYTKSIFKSNFIMITINSLFAFVGITIFYYINALASLFSYFVIFFIYYILRLKLKG